MKNLLSLSLLLLTVLLLNPSTGSGKRPIHLLVVTGGHGYDKPSFNGMLDSLSKNFTWEIAEFPAAYDKFKPENRSGYDVVVFYHMWQKSTPEQEKDLLDCFAAGKPLVALHHSICAFDEWPGYRNLIGGKYFHKPTTVDGKEIAAGTYIHDLHFKVKVAGEHPVTHGVKDFDIFDETYKGYWVQDGVLPLLTTDEPSSTPIVGWTKTYGKSRIVVLQSGHATPTYRNENFRRLLKQAIEWSYAGTDKN